MGTGLGGGIQHEQLTGISVKYGDYLDKKCTEVLWDQKSVGHNPAWGEERSPKRMQHLITHTWRWQVSRPVEEDSR